MPFTPSHAVVALPFVRTPLPPAAIAVGAMTPDLPLFVRGLGPSYVQTHSLVSLPLTLLLALALLLLWRCVLRPASRALAPAWVATRLPGEWDERAGAAFRATFGIRPRDAAGKPGPRTVFAASVFTGTTVATTALLLLALSVVSLIVNPSPLWFILLTPIVFLSGATVGLLPSMRTASAG